MCPGKAQPVLLYSSLFLFPDCNVVTSFLTSYLCTVSCNSKYLKAVEPVDCRMQFQKKKKKTKHDPKHAFFPSHCFSQGSFLFVMVMKSSITIISEKLYTLATKPNADSTTSDPWILPYITSAIT